MYLDLSHALFSRFLLMQTKTVYDGLLEDKQAKLIEEIVEKKQVLDVRCNMMAKKHPEEVNWVLLISNLVTI